MHDLETYKRTGAGTGKIAGAGQIFVTSNIDISTEAESGGVTARRPGGRTRGVDPPTQAMRYGAERKQNPGRNPDDPGTCLGYFDRNSTACATGYGNR